MDQPQGVIIAKRDSAGIFASRPDNYLGGTHNS